MGTFTTDDRIFAPRHVLGWLSFTTSAGIVNAGAVIACNNVVTHITGNVTNVALDASLTKVFGIVVASFVVGAILAVLIAETFRAKPKVAFALPLLLAFSTLLLTSVAGKANAFGAFNFDGAASNQTIPMLAALAGAMGIVNAAVAAATNNQVRITHFTGPVTDLAGNLVRAALDSGKGTASELRWAGLRFAKLISFVVGAVIAAKLAPAIEFDVFAVAGVLLMLGLALTGAPEPQASTDADKNAEPDITTMSGPVRYEDGMPPLPVPVRVVRPAHPVHKKDERRRE